MISDIQVQGIFFGINPKELMQLIDAETSNPCYTDREDAQFYCNISETEVF